MLFMSNHIIHKQKVVVNISAIDNAFQYQNALSSLFANGLSAAMQNVLDEIDEPNTVIRINELKLDLGNINSANFIQEFKEKFILQLKQSVQSISAKQDASVTVMKASSSLKDGFTYFILTGKLPWYIKVNNMLAFEADIFSKWNEPDWMYIA